MCNAGRKQEERGRLERAGAFSGYDVAERFASDVLVGRALLQFADGVQDLKMRDCLSALEWYLYGPSRDRVFLLAGLQGTGKTTVMRQAIARMSPEDLRRCAYIKIAPGDGMDQLNCTEKTLNSLDYRYVFLDEVTLAENFIDSTALFSDVYAAQGMKVVLSGKDSLGFWFALGGELYDRAYTVHTTFLPYREYSRLLGRRDIDAYIRCGGTLGPGRTTARSRLLIRQRSLSGMRNPRTGMSRHASAGTCSTPSPVISGGTASAISGSSIPPAS